MKCDGDSVGEWSPSHMMSRGNSRLSIVGVFVVDVINKTIWYWYRWCYFTWLWLYWIMCCWHSTLHGWWRHNGSKNAIKSKFVINRDSFYRYLNLLQSILSYLLWKLCNRSTVHWKITCFDSENHNSNINF